MKPLIFLFVVSLGVLGLSGSWAATEVVHRGKYSRAQMVEAIQQGNILTDAQVTAVMNELDRLQLGEGKREVGTVMHAWGWDASFYYSTARWKLRTLSYFSHDLSQSIQLRQPTQYTFTYRNGGFVMGLAYKWLIFIQVGDHLDLSQLDGAVYGGPLLGRGLGLQSSLLMGVDMQILSGRNVPGYLIIIAPQLGFGGGVRFPRVEFHRTP